MELTELSEKLGKSAGDLTNRTNDLKELLTKCKELSDSVKELRVLEKEISDFESDSKTLVEAIKVAEQELEQMQSNTKDLNQAMVEANNRVTTLTEEYMEALKKYNALKESLSSFLNNKMLRDGLELEKQDLDMKHKATEEAVEEFHQAHKEYKDSELSCQKKQQSLSQLKLTLAEKENKISSLRSEYDKKRDKIKDFNISKVDISLIDALVEVAKRVGYYNALAEKPADVKEEQVKEAIEAVVSDKEPETFTKELLYDLFMMTYEDKEVKEDDKKQHTVAIGDTDRVVAGDFNLVNVLFDDFKSMPDMVASNEPLVYVGVKHDNTGYAVKHKHPKYSAKGTKVLPTMYRVYSYVLKGLLEIHNMSYREIITVMNTFIVEDELKAHTGYFDVNAKQYKYYGKNDVFVPLAVDDEKFIAFPKKYYKYEFLGKLLEHYKHNVYAVCKKGGVIGNE